MAQPWWATWAQFLLFEVQLGDRSALGSPTRIRRFCFPAMYRLRITSNLFVGVVNKLRSIQANKSKLNGGATKIKIQNK